MTPHDEKGSISLVGFRSFLYWEWLVAELGDSGGGGHYSTSCYVFDSSKPYQFLHSFEAAQVPISR